MRIHYIFCRRFWAMLRKHCESEWILREKTGFIQAEKEAEMIVDTAKNKLERIAGESEIVKEAKKQSEEIINNAREVSYEITKGALGYADEVMAELLEKLERTMLVISQGREEIRVNFKDKNIGEQSRNMDLIVIIINCGKIQIRRCDKKQRGDAS